MRYRKARSRRLAVDPTGLDPRHSESPEWEKLLARLSHSNAIGVFLCALALFIFYAAVMLGLKAYGSSNEADTKEAYDFLAYVLPCFAGLAAGYGIYEDRIARPLFALSCLLLTFGIGAYMAAHISGHIAIGAGLCLLMAGTLIVLINEVRIFAWHGWTFARGAVYVGVGLLFCGVVLMVARVVFIGSGQQGSDQTFDHEKKCDTAQHDSG